MSRYRIHYDYLGITKSFDVDEGAIADYKEGFWLNAQLQPALASECKWWIPGSRIITIQKMRPKGP